MSSTLIKPVTADSFAVLSEHRGTQSTIDEGWPTPATTTKTVGADADPDRATIPTWFVHAFARTVPKNWDTTLEVSQTGWVVDLQTGTVTPPQPPPLQSLTVVEVNESSEAESDPPAFRAFKKLARLLDATDLEIASMVGIGEKTVYSWKRDQHEPRTATTQTLYEYEAVIDGVSSNLSEDDWRRWLHTTVGQDDTAFTRRDVLLDGRREDLAADIRAIVFGSNATRRPDLAARPEPLAADVPAPIGATTIKPSGRRPRRPKA